MPSTSLPRGGNFPRRPPSPMRPKSRPEAIDALGAVGIGPLRERNVRPTYAVLRRTTIWVPNFRIFGRKHFPHSFGRLSSSSRLTTDDSRVVSWSRIACPFRSLFAHLGSNRFDSYMPRCGITVKPNLSTERRGSKIGSCVIFRLARLSSLID